MGFIGPALGIAGAVAGIFGKRKQAKSAKRIVEAQQRQNEIGAARERLTQVREARRRQADILQTGANQGVAGSSAVLGGASSIESQLTSNLEFIAENEAVNKEISEASAGQIKGQLISGLGGAAASLGASISAFGRDEEE